MNYYLKEGSTENFNQYLAQESICQGEFFQNVVTIGARQSGFIAEIESNKWVYKGEEFKAIGDIERQAYSEKYLKMIGLFQVAIIAQPNVSPIDILIQNWGTDNWMETYILSLSHPNKPSQKMFEGLVKFSTEKMAMQV